MKMFRMLFLIALMAVSTILISGCATTSEDNVSSIPWDRPQPWEGTGQLGGFAGPGGMGR